MTKNEAVEIFVEKFFSPIPTEWVRNIAEKSGEDPRFPMWGTMWIVDNYRGEKLFSKAECMQECEKHWHGARDCYEDCDQCDYYDEEMEGEWCVTDVDGHPTNIYIYEIDGRYLIGVHGAGWNFYDGVWDVIYDRLGINWHNEESAVLQVA